MIGLILVVHFDMRLLEPLSRSVFKKPAAVRLREVVRFDLPPC